MNASDIKPPSQSNYQKQKEIDTIKKEELLKYLYADESDEKLKEFLSVMRPRKSGNANTWANDDVLVANSSGQVVSKRLSKRQLLQKEEEECDQVQEDEEDEEYQDLKLSNQETSEKSIQDESLELKDQEEKEVEMEEMENSKNSIAFDSNISDLDYLKSKMKQPIQEKPDVVRSAIHPSRLQFMQDVVEAQDHHLPADCPISHEKVQAVSMKSDSIQETQEREESQETQETKESQEIQESKETQETQDTNPVSLIGETGRLFVRNLPYNIEQEELESLFSKFGPLTEVHIPIYKDTKLQKGFAFVQFMLPEHAVNAYVDLDSTIFQGRIMEIIPGKEKLVNKESEQQQQQQDSSGSFKSKKEAELKKSAGNEYNWNSLFMNVLYFDFY